MLCAGKGRSQKRKMVILNDVLEPEVVLSSLEGWPVLCEVNLREPCRRTYNKSASIVETRKDEVVSAREYHLLLLQRPLTALRFKSTLRLRF